MKDWIVVEAETLCKNTIRQQGLIWNLTWKTNLMQTAVIYTFRSNKLLRDFWDFGPLPIVTKYTVGIESNQSWQERAWTDDLFIEYLFSKETNWKISS